MLQARPGLQALPTDSKKEPTAPKRSRSARKASKPAPAATRPAPSAADKAKPPSLIVVKRSPIQGRGVFARRDIAKGKKVVEYTGEQITHDEANVRYDDENQERHHTFLFTIDDERVIDGARGGNEARYINHSCNPNCEAIVSRGRIFIYARRAIAAGEELTYDYWYTTDPSYTLDELRRLYPCRCGAKRCRGTLAAVRRKQLADAKKARGAAA